MTSTRPIDHPHFSDPSEFINRRSTSSNSPIDNCNYKHWLVVMDHPIGDLIRNQTVERHIQTLASASDSEEEANRSICSVSTKYYNASGCKVDENVVIKSIPDVRWLLPDSYLCIGNN